MRGGDRSRTSLRSRRPRLFCAGLALAAGAVIAVAAGCAAETRERVPSDDEGSIREREYDALAYEKAPGGLPVLEAAVLDVELTGEERYAALEALAWWDTDDAIAVLERLHGSFTSEEDRAYLLAIDGAISRVGDNIAAAKSRSK